MQAILSKPKYYTLKSAASYRFNHPQRPFVVRKGEVLTARSSVDERFYSGRTDVLVECDSSGRPLHEGDRTRRRQGPRKAKSFRVYGKAEDKPQPKPFTPTPPQPIAAQPAVPSLPVQPAPALPEPKAPVIKEPEVRPEPESERNPLLDEISADAPPPSPIEELDADGNVAEEVQVD